MHIAIDARMYGTAQRGIGRYLMKLIEQLEIVDKENKYTIFLRRANFDEYQPRNPNFKKFPWDAPWYGWREQVSFSQLCHSERSEESRANARNRTSVRDSSSPTAPQNDKRGGADLIHFPHWNVPLLFNRPFIVTIHDLELFSSNRTRENSTRGRFVYWFKFQAFKIIFRHAVLKARAIIVPSNFVREQLLDLYPQVRKKVEVIYEAATIEGPGIRGQVSESNLEPNTWNLKPQCYVLYVGAAYPHKNLARLLEAWDIVHKELPEYKLVLVGREDFFWKKLKNEWPHNPSQPPLTLRGGDRSEPPLRVRGGRGSYESNGVVFYGAATDEELATLYQNAALLVQPSLEEGFSLSPLEALSFGCSVAVSDIPVHREILEDVALFFDPQDIASIVAIIAQALTDQTGIEKRLARGKELLAKYSWQTNAQATGSLYRSVASQASSNSVK